jgi:hypothetical protein
MFLRNTKMVIAHFKFHQYNLKSVENLKLAKQKSPSRWQLITFGWPILNF